MKPGDLVYWKFGASISLMPENKTYIALILEIQDTPVGSFIILLQNGETMGADASELEVIGESG